MWQCAETQSEKVKDLQVNSNKLTTNEPTAAQGRD